MQETAQPLSAAQQREVDTVLNVLPDLREDGALKFCQKHYFDPNTIGEAIQNLLEGKVVSQEWILKVVFFFVVVTLERVVYGRC